MTSTLDAAFEAAEKAYDACTAAVSARLAAAKVPGGTESTAYAEACAVASVAYAALVEADNNYKRLLNDAYAQACAVKGEAKKKLRLARENLDVAEHACLTEMLKNDGGTL